VRPAIAAALAALLSGAFAAEAESPAPAETYPDIVDLGEDEVIAPPEETRSLGGQKTSFVTSIEPAEQPPGGDLGAALRSALGVHVESLGGLGQYATMSIRGSSGNQVAVYLDGVRVSGGGGAVDLASFPLAHFERIEVLRGTSGARFGDAALGGVVNLVTPRGAEGTWGSLSLGQGIYTGNGRGTAADIVQIGSTFGHGEERWRFLGSVQGAWTNGDFLYKPDADLGLGRRDTRRRNNAYESLGALLKGGYSLGAAWEVYGLAEVFAADKEIPGLTSFPTPEAAQDDRRLLLVGGSRAVLPDLGGLEVDGRVSVLAERSDYRDPGGGITGFPYETSNRDTTFGQELTLVAPLGTAHRLRLSEELRRETFDGDGVGSHDRTTVFASLADTYMPLGDRVTLMPQGAIDLCDGGDTLLCGGIGGEFKPWSFLALRANVGSGYRRPSFQELYYDLGFLTGNPELDAERSVGFDAGPVLALDWFRAEAGYFRTVYDDLIVYLLQSGFRFKPYNVGKAVAEGVEVGGSMEPWEHLRLRANWTYAEVLDKTRDPSSRDRQVPGKPRNAVFVRCEVPLWNLCPYGEYHFVGRNPVTRANTKMLAARHVANLGIRCRLGESLAIEAACKNLTDERAVDVRGFPLPSRTVAVALTFQW